MTSWWTSASCTTCPSGGPHWTRSLFTTALRERGLEVGERVRTIAGGHYVLGVASSA
jgi:hypothetical protein